MADATIAWPEDWKQVRRYPAGARVVRLLAARSGVGVIVTGYVFHKARREVWLGTWQELSGDVTPEHLGRSIEGMFRQCETFDIEAAALMDRARLAWFSCTHPLQPHVLWHTLKGDVLQVTVSDKGRAKKMHRVDFEPYVKRLNAQLRKPVVQRVQVVAKKEGQPGEDSVRQVLNGALMPRALHRRFRVIELALESKRSRWVVSEVSPSPRWRVMERSIVKDQVPFDAGTKVLASKVGVALKVI